MRIVQDPYLRGVELLNANESDTEILRQAVIEAGVAVQGARLLVVFLQDEPAGPVVLRARLKSSGAAVIVIGPPGEKAVVDALRAGAEDYIVSNATVLDIAAALRRAAATPRSVGLRKTDLLVGDSVAMSSIRSRIDALSKLDHSILITGETGTGKELAAHALHYSGARRHKPFIAVNVGAIAESLAEAELFGAKRGAYTGADSDREGLFQAAEGGTLFLDEIGTASHALQTKLLRALERHEVTPVGGTTPVPVSVRIVAAMNVEPKIAVAKGELRADLYYRLAAYRLDMPALRAHSSDIPEIVEHYFSLQHTAGPPPTITPEALRRLMSYDWPGNVRELINVLHSAMLVGGACIGPEALLLDAEVRADEPQSVPSYKDAKHDFEVAYVRRALASTGGNVAEAARLAGKDRRDFYDLLRRTGLDADSFRLEEARPVPPPPPPSASKRRAKSNPAGR
ncbi:MAG: sigma-54-dependent Fis family transcriptional regulator [Deltaproteobacteria bacterium]|nr:sigma-54-dependent Fis family transcriptional regulator [Deltaproteobacteria bacterium]